MPSPYAHQKMLEKFGHGGPFTALQMPVNPVDTASPHSFSSVVIPRASELGIGVLAMKTLADGRFFSEKKVGEALTWQTDHPIVPGQLTVGDCLSFAWSLPVSVLITGAENPGYLREKAAICRSFATTGESDRRKWALRMLEYSREGRVEYYKSAPLRS